MSNTISRRQLLSRAAAAAAAGALSGGQAYAEPGSKRVIVWSEGTAPKRIYPNDVNTAIAEGLRPLRGWDVRTASLTEPDQGLPDELLASCSVLIWWGHQRHGDVSDALVDRIYKRVTEEGMGFIPTHSAHFSKPFKKIVGGTGAWKGGYRDDGSKLDVLVMLPRHPIARGIKSFTCPHTERYSEPFDVPAPEAVVLGGIYTLPDGTTEHSRQGLTWTRGKGRMFYFHVGHEGYPMYFQEDVRHVFRNAVLWAAG